MTYIIIVWCRTSSCILLHSNSYELKGIPGTRKIPFGFKASISENSIHIILSPDMQHIIYKRSLIIYFTNTASSFLSFNFQPTLQPRRKQWWKVFVSTKDKVWKTFKREPLWDWKGGRNEKSLGTISIGWNREG